MGFQDAGMDFEFDGMSFCIHRRQRLTKIYPVPPQDFGMDGKWLSNLPGQAQIELSLQYLPKI